MRRPREPGRPRTLRRRRERLVGRDDRRAEIAHRLALAFHGDAVARTRAAQASKLLGAQAGPVVLDEVGLPHLCRSTCHGSTLRRRRRETSGVSLRLCLASRSRSAIRAPSSAREADAELAVDAREVGLDGLRAHEGGARDLAVRQSRRGKLGDAPLGRASARPARGAGRRGRARPAPAPPRWARRAARRSREPRASASAAARLCLTRRCSRPSTSSVQPSSNGSRAPRRGRARRVRRAPPSTSPSAASTSARARGSVDRDPESGKRGRAPRAARATSRARSSSPSATRDSTWNGSLRSGASSVDADRLDQLPHPRQRLVGRPVVGGRELDEAERGEDERRPPRPPRALGLLDERQQRRRARARSGRGGHRRASGSGTRIAHGPGARAARQRAQPPRRTARPASHRPARSSASARCASRSARQTSSPRSRYQLVLYRVTRPRGIEVVDRVEADQRERALRRLRAGPCLQLAPPLEELPARGRGRASSSAKKRSNTTYASARRLLAPRSARCIAASACSTARVGSCANVKLASFG